MSTYETRLGLGILGTVKYTEHSKKDRNKVILELIDGWPLSLRNSTRVSSARPL